jgi:APA family basic amino acid/polyamine antiporter
MLSFTIAHAAVIGLRISQPDAERPWTGPGNVRIRGRSIPMFAVFGGLGTGIAFVVVSVLELSTLAFGVGWLLVGVLLYVWYRHNQGLALTQTVKAVQPKAIVEREVEYESVLVAFENGHYDPEAIATARKLAARRRRGIHVLVTITVPASAPINAALPEDEARAQETIDSARVMGGRRVTGHWEKIRPGEAGRRIVDDAEAIQARAIVMSLRRRRSGAPDLGRTLEYVLAHRPCRVVVSAQPATAKGATPSASPRAVGVARPRS